MRSLEGVLAEDYCRLDANWLDRRCTEDPMAEAGGEGIFQDRVANQSKRPPRLYIGAWIVGCSILGALPGGGCHTIFRRSFRYKAWCRSSLVRVVQFELQETQLARAL
ncbi:hypothetical protein CHARACLAT_003095 [Characodon lateralis]|uniref:Uncharacterized protein n=1 Tax=Characodon lateralis TaxID=208331 RepID=A0ABU7CP56_9TELE|nr:hypothetical protein [Characodon lateralis]